MLPMQFMKRRIFILTVFLLLIGCVSSGGNNPWERYTYNQRAEASPRHLGPPPDVVPVSSLYQQTGIEFISPPSLEMSNSQNVPHEFEFAFEQSPVQQQQPGTNITARPPAPAYSQSVRVALLVPLSGEHAHLGQAMLQAAQLALFDMKYNRFELLPRDTKATVEGAREAAQSALDAGAELILGPLFASSVQAVKPIIRRRNVNMLAFSTDWSLADNHTFIMGFLPFAQVQRVTEFAMRNDIKNIAILAPNTDYGNAVIASYNSLAYRMGLDTANVVRFPVDESDISGIVRAFTKYDERVEALNQLIRPLKEYIEQYPEDTMALTQMKELESFDTWGDLPFDAVLLPVGGDRARAIANLLSFYDLGPDQVKRLGTGLWDDPGLATEQSMRGAWFAASSVEQREGFEKRYQETFGNKPPRLASLAYDATALAAILARNSDRKHGRAVFHRNALINPNGFAGVDGIFRFRPDGLIERGLAVLEMGKKDIKVIDAAPHTFQRPVTYR